MLSIVKDRVFRALLASLVVLALLDAPQFSISVVETSISLWEMLPFFLLAVALAAYAKATQADALIAKAFSGHPLRATLLAALVGAVSPFCSCGVIPAYRRNAGRRCALSTCYGILDRIADYGSGNVYSHLCWYWFKFCRSENTGCDSDGLICWF